MNPSDTIIFKNRRKQISIVLIITMIAAFSMAIFFAHADPYGSVDIVCPEYDAYYMVDEPSVINGTVTAGMMWVNITINDGSYYWNATSVAFDSSTAIYYSASIVDQNWTWDSSGVTWTDGYQYFINAQGVYTGYDNSSDSCQFYYIDAMDDLSGFTASPHGPGVNYLEWTPPTGTDYVYVEYSFDDPLGTPWNIGDETFLCNMSVTNDTKYYQPITELTIYYYQAWSYNSHGGGYSVNALSDDATSESNFTLVNWTVDMNTRYITMNFTQPPNIATISTGVSICSDNSTWWQGALSSITPISSDGNTLVVQITDKDLVSLTSYYYLMDIDSSYLSIYQGFVKDMDGHDLAYYTGCYPLLDPGQGPGHQALSYTADTTPPVLNVEIVIFGGISPPCATVGDIVYVHVQSDEPLTEYPSVTIVGYAADSVTWSPQYDPSGSHTEFMATRTMQIGDTNGNVTFTVNGDDLFSNPGDEENATTDASYVNFDTVPPVIDITYPLDGSNVIILDHINGTAYDTNPLLGGAACIYVAFRNITDDTSWDFINVIWVPGALQPSYYQGLYYATNWNMTDGVETTPGFPCYFPDWLTGKLYSINASILDKVSLWGYDNITFTDPTTYTGETPSNNSISVSLQPVCNVTVHTNTFVPCDILLLAWNGTGYSTEYQDVSSDPVENVNFTYANASSYSTSYDWQVCTKGVGMTMWHNETFTFTTLDAPPPNYPPGFTNEIPINGTTGTSRTLDWSIDIHDNETFNWTIQCDGDSNYSNDDTNGTKTLSLSGLSYSTTYTVYVNATDGLLWTRQWFTFTTEDYIPPPNNAPVFTNEYPVNGTNGTAIAFTWNITITDPDHEVFDWNISCPLAHQYNSTTGASDGSKTLSLSGLSYSTNYTVYVNCTDGTDWTRERFFFITTFPPPPNNPPVFSNENPANGSINQTLSFLWTIDINDTDGDGMFWTIECNGLNNTGLTGNTTANISLSGLSYNTTYTVYVNCTDSTDNTSEWFTFTTGLAPVVPPAPSSPTTLDLAPLLYIVVLFGLIGVCFKSISGRKR